MKTIIKGQNYNFCIVAGENRFYIEAIHATSCRFSYINNLNVILSALDIEENDKKVSESQWCVSQKQSRIFFEKVIKFLSNKHSRNFVEKQLDEDRQLGEWENIK